MTDDELERKRAEQQALRDRLAESPTLPLDDPPDHDAMRRAGLVAGYEGAARAAAHVDHDWRAHATVVLDRLIHEREEVDADDVWEECGEPPEGDHRAMGDIFSKASKAGLIVKTGRINASRRPTRHGGDVKVWRSLRRTGA